MIFALRALDACGIDEGNVWLLALEKLRQRDDLEPRIGSTPFVLAGRPIAIELLDSFEVSGRLARMTHEQRAQVRLIIEHEVEARTKEFEEKLRAMYHRHAAAGHLKAGVTIKMAVRYMEDTTVALIKNAIAEVSKVAMDVDAFTMIHAAIHEFQELLRRRLDDAFHKATGHTASSGLDRAAHGAATRLFEEQKVRTLRQLEIHRFSFTKPSEPPRITMKEPLAPRTKNKGGRPAAAHWDEMWSALAVMLYVGDLKPQRQADIERAMKDWLVANGHEAGDTPVRERARVLWSKLERAE